MAPLAGTLRLASAIAFLIAAIVALGAIGLLVLSGPRSAGISEVHASDQDRALQVMLATCNADVSVDVDEYDDRIVVSATHHDWYRFLAGSDDCADVVTVDLDQPLGQRAVTTADGEPIAIVRP